MIKVNGEAIKIGSFPDGTMLFKQNVSQTEKTTISWFYEDDRELVALIFLSKHLKAHGCENLHLNMPYIPNARQDRVKKPEDVFTLKYFAELLNGLGFKSVSVLDPHSNVSQALIDNITVLKPKFLIEKVINRIAHEEGEKPAMFYPDEGAGKRYSDMISLPYSFGVKKRDWETGQIKGLDVIGDVEGIGGKNILIVDDICSKGGTFLHSASKLKELGAKNIYLYVSHCENSILKGELPESGLIKKVFTTNSIFTENHPLIEVFDWKKEEQNEQSY